MKPGEYFLDETRGPIEANAGRPVIALMVRHTGDRPIQVGSHFHFHEVNRALDFDRAATFGHRLNVAAGTAVRFEPGEEKEVTLTPFAGLGVVLGHNGIAGGDTEGDAAHRRLEEWLSQ